MLLLDRLKANMCRRGKCGSVLLFKDSAVFLTNWLTVLVVRVSQKMFIRHLEKRAGPDGGRRGGKVGASVVQSESMVKCDCMLKCKYRVELFKLN